MKKVLDNIYFVLHCNFFKRKDSTVIKQRHQQQQREDYRKELWVRVAVAVAQASNSTTRYMMEKWADHALAEFDKRFKG
jgi:hypothetical protein